MQDLKMEMHSARLTSTGRAGRFLSRRPFGFVMVLGLSGAALLGPGCAGRPHEKTTLVLDTEGTSAVELYDLGVSQLLAGNLDRAEEAFRSSLAVARKSGLDFAPPHEGLARVLLSRNDLEKAELEARYAQELDKFWTPVYWVLGKLKERDGDNEMALAHYERGLVSSPGDPELTEAAADLLTRMGREREAVELRKRGHAAPGGSSTGRQSPRTTAKPPAGSPHGLSDLETRTRILLQPFFPDTEEVLTPRLLAVFQQDFLTRGALAVLITGDGEHGLAGALARSSITEGTITPPADTQHRPEDAWIDKALAMGLMETFPDGTFRPDQVMTRLTLSLWIEETIARLRNDRRVFDLYRGQKSPFPDIPDGHYGLNAARVAVDLGLLKAGLNGAFGLEKSVTVAEGVHAVSRLGPALLGQIGNR
jgi:tetratricopeptide (TPR) repeat protein